MKISSIRTIDKGIINKVLFNLPTIIYDEADYMIIFGCHFKELTIERLNKSIEILNSKKISKIVVTGGVGKNGNYNEAQFMFNYLIGHNINSKMIIVEDKSTTTEENIVNTFNLLNSELKNKRVILVSNEPHLKRIGMKIKKDYSNYNNELIYEYPSNSKLSYENIINDDDLYRLAKNEIDKIKRFINAGLLEDEEI